MSSNDFGALWEIDMPAWHMFWIALVVTNLVVQVLCFLRDENQPLHWAKKLTTPLLLFSAFLILYYIYMGVLISTGSPFARGSSLAVT